MAGLAGQRVLEVGGSLPRDLVIGEVGASQWWGIEDYDYWNALPENPEATCPKTVPTEKLGEVPSPDILGEYGILFGRIEQLPPTLHGHFTRVFSIACFEHIHRMGQALQAMYAALAPGGLLFTMFSPIWSAWDGHHTPQNIEVNGERWDWNKVPIPPWGHLLLTPA